MPNLVSKVWKSPNSFHMGESVIEQVLSELLELTRMTSFVDLPMCRNLETRYAYSEASSARQGYRS